MFSLSAARQFKECVLPSSVKKLTHKDRCVLFAKIRGRPVHAIPPPRQPKE